MSKFIIYHTVLDRYFIRLNSYGGKRVVWGTEVQPIRKFDTHKEALDFIDTQLAGYINLKVKEVNEVQTYRITSTGLPLLEYQEEEWVTSALNFIKGDIIEFDNREDAQAVIDNWFTTVDDIQIEEVKPLVSQQDELEALEIHLSHNQQLSLISLQSVLQTIADRDDEVFSAKIKANIDALISITQQA